MEERIEELEVKIKELLDDKKYHQIRELLMDLNEADIAEIIETIEIKAVSYTHLYTFYHLIQFILLF